MSADPYIDSCHRSQPHSPSLYDSREFGNVPRCYFQELDAAIHLAHKYQCPDVEKRALFTLKKYYTSHFVEFDTYDMSRTTLYPPSLHEAIAAVNIARLTDTPSMLPFALYRTCMLEARMMDGYKRLHGPVEYLSVQDLRLCTGARSDLARELATVIKHVFARGPAVECEATEECSEVWDEILEDVELNARGACNPLEPCSECIDVWTKDRGLCDAYKQKMRQREREERKRVWTQLPSIFGMTFKACGFTTGDERFG